MRISVRLAAVPAAVIAMAAPLAGCSDFPSGDPNPGTVRVYLDRDFDQTWQLAACDPADEESLAVSGSNAAGERLVIEVNGGSGSASVLAGSTVVWSGTIEDYDFDGDGEGQFFDAEGEYRSGEETGKLELKGNCTPAEGR